MSVPSTPMTVIQMHSAPTQLHHSRAIVTIQPITTATGKRAILTVSPLSSIMD